MIFFSTFGFVIRFAMQTWNFRFWISKISIQIEGDRLSVSVIISWILILLTARSQSNFAGKTKSNNKTQQALDRTVMYSLFGVAQAGVANPLRWPLIEWSWSWIALSAVNVKWLWSLTDVRKRRFYCSVGHGHEQRKFKYHRFTVFRGCRPGWDELDRHQRRQSL